ncbi:hypothetical protein A0J61_07686 [Choanephora cucurbitarum]|uniref:Uncharacterized protein n=1 Tax=Choanephora cucurbitarum TaxID=101091 RepID=A0A1C7N586_9FUNG|nr:hypothetical protein A0J61_07686 [Choanephora cucurbitarum]
MAVFPNKTLKPTAIMSPRQTANKAYTLTIKKLDKDEKRCRPHYSIREKLLLSNTLAKAEQILNKQACLSRKSWVKQEDVLAPLPHYAPPSETKVQQWMSSIPEHMVLSIAVITFQQQPLSCRPISSFSLNSLTPII